MTEEELDLLPYGVIELDNTGNIICFNRTEQEAVKMRSENVCGRNFFTDVAPCTAVKEFQDSFIEFLKNDESTREFKFTFPFPRGLTKVRIAFIRKNTQSGFVIINRSGPQE